MARPSAGRDGSPSSLLGRFPPRHRLHRGAPARRDHHRDPRRRLLLAARRVPARALRQREGASRAHRDRAREGRAPALPPLPRGEAWTRPRRARGAAPRRSPPKACSPPRTHIDCDYWRALRAPAALRPQPRLLRHARGRGPGAIYEYAETFLDPASPLASLRLLVATPREAATTSSPTASPGPWASAAPPRAQVQRAYRERLAGPFAQAVGALAARPVFGPRERAETEDLLDSRPTLQKALSKPLAAPQPGSDPEAVTKAVEAAGRRVVGAHRSARWRRAGLPLSGVRRAHDRQGRTSAPPWSCPARSCAPTPASHGDTATWEFDGDDLYGRGLRDVGQGRLAAERGPPYNPAHAPHPPRLHEVRPALSGRPGRGTSASAAAPLFARYDLERAAKEMRPGHLALREPTLWRYREVLPVDDPGRPHQPRRGLHSPALRAARLGRRASAFPASSSRTRAAIPPARSRPAASPWRSRWPRRSGATDVCLPSAGNAGSALAAYAARGGLRGPRLRPQGHRPRSS